MPNENDAPSWRFFVADIDSEGGRAIRRVLTRDNLHYDVWEEREAGAGAVIAGDATPVGLFIPLISTSVSFDSLRGILSEARSEGVSRVVMVSSFESQKLIVMARESSENGLPTLLVASSEGELVGCERKHGDPVHALIAELSHARRLRKNQVKIGFAEDARLTVTYIDDLMGAALFAMTQDTGTEPIRVGGIAFKCADIVRAVSSLMKCKIKIKYGEKKIVNPSFREKAKNNNDMILLDELPGNEPRAMDGGPRIPPSLALAEIVRKRSGNGAGMLSACVIMRDNEEDIGECLESLSAADEIVVVDTGSVDRSIEIAKKYTDKIFHFKWIDDFAAAKNFALSKARGEWIVFLDSDEYFTPGTRKNIKRIAEDYSFIGGPESLQVRHMNIDLAGNPIGFEGAVVRIFGAGLEYRGAVHEAVTRRDGAPATSVAVPRERMLICHTGYAPERGKKKHERNKRIIKKLEKNGVGINLPNYYHSRMAFQDGEWEDAMRFAKKTIEAKEEMPAALRFEPYRYWYKAAAVMGDESERLAAREAMRRDMPSMPDSYALEGAELWNEGREDEAAPLLMKSLELDEKFLSENPAEMDEIEGDTANISRELAAYYEKKGDKEKARRVREFTARRMCPKNLRQP